MRTSVKFRRISPAPRTSLENTCPWQGSLHWQAEKFRLLLLLLRHSRLGPWQCTNEYQGRDLEVQQQQKTDAHIVGVHVPRTLHVYTSKLFPQVVHVGTAMHVWHRVGQCTTALATRSSCLVLPT